MPEQRATLIAATLTPLNADGELILDAVGPMVENLLEDGVQGLYVNGSTGEGVSLSIQEGMDLATEYVKCVDQRVAVFIQVGHNSLREARKLAAHAVQIQATGISATCPSYFKVDSIATLIACMREIASAAPSLPFYYYHIPSLTGSVLSMPEFLERASKNVENLAGLKFTTPELHVFQECCQVDPKLKMFWGTDEMLLPALVVGAESAIGSTYNVASPLYLEMISAYSSGNLERARELQSQAIRMIRVLQKFPFQSALKFLVARRLEQNEAAAIDSCRLPLASLTDQQKEALVREWEALGLSF